jgi:ABC-type multidrug transport system permease subunit
MVVGLLVVSISGRYQLPLNIVLIVFGMIAAVTGGLVFGIVAVAWLMKKAVQLSETSQWGRARQR